MRRFLRAWWTEVTSIGPHDQAHWGAFQVAVAVVVPLIAVVAVGRVDLAGYAVFGSLSSVYGRRFGRIDRLRTQLRAGAALVVAVALGVLAGVDGSPTITVPAMAVMSALGLVLARRYGWMPVPSLFLVLATGTISSVQHRLDELPLAIGLTAAAAMVGVVVGQLGLLTQPGSMLVPPSPPLRLAAIVRASGFTTDLVAYTVAPLAAGAAATLFGIGHPYWAAVTATVPVAGRGLSTQLARATLRLGGTVIGIGIAWGLLGPEPPLWVLVALVAILQVLTELFVARNYGIAVMCITPMALILGQLVVEHPIDQLVSDRITETVIGVVAAGLVLLGGRAVRPRPTPPRSVVGIP